MRKVAQKILSGLSRPIKVAVLQLVVRVWPATPVEGFIVLDLAGEGSRLHEHSSKIRSALLLIKECDPSRFMRIKRDVRRFLVVDVTGPEYLHVIRACMLGTEHVMSSSPKELALTIVHEATHARLSIMGFTYDLKRRERIERLCVRAEMHFAGKLEGGAQLAEQVSTKLGLRWWSEKAEYHRRLTQLEQLGWPAWYRRAYAWLWRP